MRQDYAVAVWPSIRTLEDPASPGLVLEPVILMRFAPGNRGNALHEIVEGRRRMAFFLEHCRDDARGVDFGKATFPQECRPILVGTGHEALTCCLHAFDKAPRRGIGKARQRWPGLLGEAIGGKFRVTQTDLFEILDAPEVPVHAHGAQIESRDPYRLRADLAVPTVEAGAHGEPTGRRKMGRILKIVLYGSFARGNWVDEPTTGKGYQSDFDILIIVNQPELTDWVDYWEKVDERLNREREISGYLDTPVQLVIHTLQEVNDGLAHGRYFFLDFARDGIVIYQSDESELASPQPKTPAAALKMAEEYFEDRFPYAISRFEGARFHIERGNLRA